MNSSKGIAALTISGLITRVLAHDRPAHSIAKPAPKFYNNISENVRKNKVNCELQHYTVIVVATSHSTVINSGLCYLAGFLYLIKLF